MDPTTAWEHPGFASSDPGGVALAAVKDDASLADLIRWDEVSGDTIVRAFGPGGRVKFQTSAGADFGIAWADVSKVGAVPADIGAAAVVHSHVWADVSKAGSSLADLAVRDASALSSGILLSARLAGAYTGITQVGTLATLTVSGLATTQELEFTGVVGDQKLRLFSVGTSRYGFGIANAEMRAFHAQGNKQTWGSVASTDGTTYTEMMRLFKGIFSVGTTVDTSAGAKSIVTANATATPASGGGVYGVNPGGTGTIPLIYCDQYGKVQLGGGAASVATYYGAPYAAGAAQNGTFAVDSSTPGRFWIYAGGSRFYFTGTAG